MGLEKLFTGVVICSLTRQDPCAKMKPECSEDQMEMQTANHLIFFDCRQQQRGTQQINIVPVPLNLQ